MSEFTTTFDFQQNASFRYRLTRLIGRGVDNGVLVSSLFLMVILVMFVVSQPAVLRGTLFESLIFNGSLGSVFAAAGLALVVLVGGLDLSIAGAVTLANALLTTQLHGGVFQQFGLLMLVLLIGAGSGYVNGFIVTRFKLEPVVVTLGTGFVMGGIALLILPTPASVDSRATGVIAVLTNTTGISMALVAMVIVGIAWMFIRRSRIGTALVSVGSDPNAAEQNGVSVNRTKLFAFTGSGVLYALAGAALTSQTLGGDSSVGQEYLLAAFAAVVIGGLRLGGGRGSVIGAVIGAVTLTAAVNLLFAIGLASYWGDIARGILLLIAIALQTGARAIRSRVATAVTPASFARLPEEDAK